VYREVDGVLQTAPAPRFSATPSRADPPPVPPPGAHTHEVLSDAGLSPADIERLARSSALGPSTP